MYVCLQKPANKLKVHTNGIIYTVALSDKSQEAKLCPSYQTLVLGENYLQDNFDNSRL